MKVQICFLMCYLAMVIAGEARTEQNVAVPQVVASQESESLKPLTRNRRLIGGIGGVGIVAGIGIGGIKGFGLG